MTQGDKKLLLKDLCARLPYYTELYSNVADDNWAILTPVIISNLINADKNLVIKPYLRPMSSMTDKEETLFRCELPAIAKTDAQLVAMRMELFLKGHLDFNHLIEKGLALEAPEDMYKTEKK